MRAPVRRGSEPTWMRPLTERLSRAIKTLIVVDAVLFSFYVFVKEAQPFFTQHLALGPAVRAGELWQPVTSLFVHLDFLSFLFNLIGLWFVGATIERQLGTRRMLTLFFAAGIAANVAMALVSAAVATPEIIAGCGTAVLALFVAFGVIFGRTPARVLGGLVLEARMLTAILVGFALLADLMRGSLASLVGDVVAIVLGYVLSGGRGHELRGLWSNLRARRSRRRYQVLEGGRSGPRPPSYLN